MATVFLHEVHEISGGAVAAFEESFRAAYRPLLERDGDARLLWFWHLTHGTGPSYQVVTVTAFAGWDAWTRHVDRVSVGGDLHDWVVAAGATRRAVVGKLLRPVPWSAVQDVDFARPAQAPEPGPTLHLHDTGWPFPGKLDAYVAALGSVLYPQTRQSKMISIEACFVTCPGTGLQDEVLILQRILDWDRFASMIAGGEGPARGGQWMSEGLKYRDRWESKLLRGTAWCPRSV